MRYVNLCLITFCSLYNICTAQNLVPNASFESFNNCPSSLVSMPYTSGYDYFPTLTSWTTPVKLSTPDYLNDCATLNSGLRTPNSIFGYQLAKTGVSYTGIIAFQAQYVNGNPIYDYREYLQTRLLQSMIAGKQYCVSFFVSPTLSSTFTLNYVALDEIGINFSSQRPVDTIDRTISLPYHIKNTAGNYLSDTSKWYKVSGVYTAAGGEEWLTLGTFKNGGFPGFINLYPTIPSQNGTHWSYLFIDDVSVYEMTSADTIRAAHDTTVCTTTGLNINLNSPVNATSYLWQNGSISGQISVNDTGTFWCVARQDCTMFIDTFHIKYTPFEKLDLGKDSTNCLSLPVTLSANHNYDSYTWNNGANTSSITVNQSGMYILTISDICGTQTDTVDVTIQSPTPPPIVHDTTICQFTASPGIRVEGSNLKWYYEDFSYSSSEPYITTELLGLQTFYVSQTIGKCESPKVPVNVTIKYRPTAYIGDYYVFCTGEDTLLGSEYPDVSYKWNTGEQTCCIHPRKTGTYELTISNECGTSSDTAFIEIFPCDDCLFVPTAFTPNSDGKNDRFIPIIKCPVYNYRMNVYNRWGELVFSTHNPVEGWNGTFKSNKADMGVYVYVMEYNSVNTKSRKFLKGNFTLIR